MEEKINRLEQYLLDVIRLFQNDEDVVFAYLFGSYSAGRQSILSDVDIAVYLRKGSSHFYLEEERELSTHLMSIFNGEKVDLVILNVIPLLLQYRIVKTGKLIFSRDEIARTNYETRVMLRYFDLKPHLEEYDQELHRRIKSGVI